MPEESAAIRFEDDGMVSIFVGTQSNGQGHETAFTQIVSDRLGLDAERIRIIMGDTDAIPTGGGTGGSRSLVSTGTAINKMSDTVIDKGKAAAAELFETSAVDIEFGKATSASSVPTGPSTLSIWRRRPRKWRWPGRSRPRTRARPRR